jgi:hypothetical protein
MGSNDEEFIANPEFRWSTSTSENNTFCGRLNLAAR